MLGRESWRREVLARGEDVPCFLWSPDELRERDANPTLFLEDGALRSQCDVFAQLLGMKSSTAAGRKVLHQVAQRLNAVDWKGTLQVTSDFVVLAADNSGEIDPVRDAKACLPARRFADLRARLVVGRQPRGAAGTVGAMSHKHPWLLVLLACAGAGCRKQTVAVAPAPPAPSKTEAVVPSAAPVPPDASAHDALPDGVLEPGRATVPRVNLIVAGDHGVRELGPDGKVVRTITRAGGRHPRFVGPDEIVMLTLADDMSGEVKSVRRVSLVTGKSTVVARIPRLGCREREDLSLALQSASDFGVTEDGAYACLDLADRNENMASVAVSVRIDLRTGKVALHQDMGHEKDWGEQRCNIKGASGPKFECRARQPESADSRVPGLNEIEGIPAFEPDDADSLSGSWMILHGELQDADYIHRPLVLLDRRDGKAYPIRPGAWPKPLSRRELKRIAKAATEGDPDKAGTLIAVGETELRWVRIGGKDALIAEGTLYIPGAPSVDLGGEVAY